MANANANQVIVSGKTILDLRSDTVTPKTLQKGITAHDKSGAQITGTLEVPATEERTVELSMPSGDQVIQPTSGKVMSKVTVRKPAALLPENIKSGVSIGGVTGTYEGSGGGSSGSGSYNIAVTENSDGSQNLAITDAASTDLPVVETWVFNESLTKVPDEDVTLTAEVPLSICDVSYNQISFSSYVKDFSDLYAEKDFFIANETNVLTYYRTTLCQVDDLGSSSWHNTYVRTIKFHEAVPDGDFKTWLQANAVKQ